MSQSPLQDLILRLAARHEGVAPKDVNNTPSGSFNKACQKLVNRGLLFRGSWGGKMCVRYFTREKDALAHDEAGRARTRHLCAKPRTKAPWSADTPAVITKQTKVTIAPPPVHSLRTNTHSNWGG